MLGKSLVVCSEWCIVAFCRKANTMCTRKIMSDNCLFCKIIKGAVPSDKLYEDDDVFVFRDIAPQAPVHFLVIPKKHVKGPGAVEAGDERLMGKLIRVADQVARQEGISQYRLVFNNGEKAGQTVFHIHMHVLGGRSLTWPPG